MHRSSHRFSLADTPTNPEHSEHKNSPCKSITYAGTTLVQTRNNRNNTAVDTGDCIVVCNQLRFITMALPFFSFIGDFMEQQKLPIDKPRLAISLRPECIDGLDDVRDMLKKQMGVQMSYSKTVEFLLVFYRKARGLEKE